MTEYNALNVNFLIRNLINWSLEQKLETEVTSNVAGDSNVENNFPHKLILTNTKVSWLCKAFVNNYSPNMKLLTTQ